MRIKATLFIVAFLIWLLLNWALDLEHIFIGILVGILVALVTADIFESPARILKNIRRVPWFIYYLLLFTWECIKANLDGAYRVMHPDLPMHPGIVKVKTQLKSDVGLTFLANSLTLTPGTMTVDIDREGGFLYIHWINVKEQDVDKATALIVRKFEAVLLRIFG